MKSGVGVWISSARPRTLPAALAPVAIGASMAYRDGPVDPFILAATALSALFIQIGTNFANDYFDFRKGTDTPDRVGPTRATAAGLVTPRQMMFATVIAFALAVAFGGVLVQAGGLPIVIIGILSLLCGVLYTAGPFPLGYIGLGEIFVFIFFGPVAVGGTYYVLHHMVTPSAIMAGIAPGLLATAILVVNNYRDRFTDAKTGKRTLVVRLGGMFGQVEYAICVVNAVFFPALLVVHARSHFGALAACATLIPAVWPLRTMLRSPDAPACNRLLGETGRLLLIYSALFSLGWILT